MRSDSSPEFGFRFPDRRLNKKRAPILDDLETPPPTRLRTRPEKFSTKVFPLYKSLVGITSPFLAAALKKAWTDLRQGPIQITFDYPDAFRVYCEWLLTRPDRIDLSQVTTSRWALGSSLAYAYVLGEHLLDAEFRNEIIHAMLTHYINSSALPDELTVKTIYSGTTIEPPARVLIVDLYVYGGTVKMSTWRHMASHTCCEFIDDLVCALFRVRQKAPLLPKRLKDYQLRDPSSLQKGNVQYMGGGP
ncbi:hypothetical protein BDV96DRAFT_594041 [Lophiotrema nucula]|uniref:BTB domain-containing protein n=1 Tax=Lophiotrema nucula TaxID=690887 RepID=A0A6A5ZTC3_9PLEO|nr:hypothetical protein BDV96DRAFT_594041 [Lophiotrema nucula]